MDKPASVQVVELRKNIINAINEAKLPPWAVRPILSEILMDITRAEERQFRADLAAWQKGGEGDGQSASAGDNA